MPDVQSLCDYLDALAPESLAEDWDNVGLLVGSRGALVQKLMTCLTLTPDCVQEAIDQQADLVVTHHPLPFRPLKRITSDDVTGRSLLQLIEHRIAVYSAHTRFDSADQGINRQIAEGLDLVDIQPIVSAVDESAGNLGSGRWGRCEPPLTLDQLVERIQMFFGIGGLHVVAGGPSTIERIGVACGAAGGFLQDAHRLGCHAFLTGETNLHTALEARSLGMHLLLPGHFATERFAMERLAATIGTRFADLTAWAARLERDPLQWR